MTFLQPWRFTSKDDRLKVFSILFHVAEAVRIGAILAQPFMPVKARKILDEITVDPSRRRLSFAQWAADDAYGKRPSGKVEGPVQVFPKMPWMETPSGKSRKLPKPRLDSREKNSGLAEEHVEAVSQ